MGPSHPKHTPGYERGDASGVDPGNQLHPTGENQYNYFDALTRWYLEVNDNLSSNPGNYLIDEIEFYQEPYAENDQQIYSLVGTYVPASNRVIVAWDRLMEENNVNHEVRYAFSDIHAMGWNAATPAPNGTIVPGVRQRFATAIMLVC